MTRLPERIRTTSRAATWLIAAVLAVVTLPSPAQAHGPLAARASRDLAPDTVLYGDAETYERSADLLVKDALRLDDVDLEKAKKLRAAGRLYHHAGLFRQARTTTLHAGIAAYHAGEHAMSAHIFIDAAEASLNRDMRYGAESAADRAGWVLRNGELTSEERTSVLDRVKYLDGIEVEASKEERTAGG